MKLTFIKIVGLAISVSALADSTVSNSIYVPFGKRDPFLIPEPMTTSGGKVGLNPLQKYQLERYKLRGVLKGLGKAKAMFEDPVGVAHVVTEGELIGIEKAKVSKIIESEVIVTERTINYLGKESLLEKVFSLPKENDQGVINYSDAKQK